MSAEEKAEILDGDMTKDGLENLIAGMGNEKDKRSYSHFVNNKRLSATGNESELEAMYRTDWVAGKVVDIKPDDMTREWRNFTGDITPEQVKQLEEEEDRLAITEEFNQAHKWGRLFGSSLIVMSIDDGQTPDKPLNINTIKKGGLRHLKVVERERFNHADTVPTNDPLDANFGLPESYRFTESSVIIHHSRVLRFDGIKLPFKAFRENGYNSDSVLDRLYDALINFNTTTNGTATMVHETNVDIVQIKGLMNLLATPDGESLVRKRFGLATLLKSFSNAMVLDSEEDYTNKTNSFAGLTDIMSTFALFLSGASDTPATRMLGSAASGLNATGEGDLKNYYDTVRSDQKKIYKPKLDYLDVIMAKSLGMGEDLDLSYEFNSLFQMTPKEKADTDFTNAQRDAIYLDQGVINEEIVAKDLKQNKVYTNITDEHIKDLEDIIDEPDADTDDLDLTNEPEEQEGKEKEDPSDTES